MRFQVAYVKAEAEPHWSGIGSLVSMAAHHLSMAMKVRAVRGLGLKQADLKPAAKDFGISAWNLGFSIRFRALSSGLC